MRIFLVSVLILGIGLLGFKIYLDLNEEKVANKSPLIALPSNPFFLMEINEVSSNWNHFTETNMIWSEFVSDKNIQKEYGLIYDINNFLNNEFISPVINDGKVYVGGYNINGVVELLLIKNTYSYEKTHPSFSLNDSSLANVLPSVNWHSSYISPFIVLSSSKELLDKSIYNLQNKETISNELIFSKSEKLISSSSTFSFFIDFIQFNQLMFADDSNYGHYLSENKGISNWFQFDFNYTPNSINLIGVSDCENSKLKYSPKYINDPSLLPEKIDILSKKSIKYNFGENDDLNDDYSNNSILELLHIKLANQLISSSEELFFIERPKDVNKEAYFFDNIAFDPDLSKQLNNKELKSVNTVFLKNIFDYDYQENLYCYVDDQYYIISTYNGLKEWDYQLKQKKKITIEEAIFADKSSSFLNQAFSEVDYWSGKELDKMLNLFFNSNHVKNYIKNKISGISWSTSFLNEGFLHHVINIQKGLHKEEDQKILWTASSKPIFKGPYVMKNHRTGTNDVFVQDTTNVVSLYGASGKLKWKLNINEPIIGTVSQIDIYNNKKWQMVFNTAHKLYVVDINGNLVKGFPVKFNYLATNKVGILDYDSDKNYRFLVAGSDKIIHNYDKYGKTVKGWNLPKIQSEVNVPVQHFTIAGKDYVFVSEKNGNIRFLNRRGEKRKENIENIHIKSLTNFIVQKSYSFDSSSVIYIDTNNKLKKIRFDGVCSDLEFSLDSSQNFIPFVYEISSSSINYAFVSKTKLLVLGSKKQTYLDKESNYSLLNNVALSNYYLTLYNDESEEIELIDRRYQQIPSVFRGTKKCTIGDLNNDGIDELITIINESTLLCYQIAPSN